MNTKRTVHMTNLVNFAASFDFNLTKDYTDHKAKRNYLLGAKKVISNQFNEFIRASIRMFHGAGNHNVLFVNDLLQIAARAKGDDVARLAAYLRNVIPHKLEDDGEKGKVPWFGEKLKNKEYNAEEMETFLTKHPHWADYGRAVKSDAHFDLGKFEDQVVRKLIENGAKESDINKFIVNVTTKFAAKKAAGASK